jgi:Asp-tRNA(Asn)/Glu-tRNA(Gln) amidotransferase A subunit family amidase
VGTTREALPIGVQVVAKAGDDLRVVRIADELEGRYGAGPGEHL